MFLQEADELMGSVSGNGIGYGGVDGNGEKNPSSRAIDMVWDDDE